MGNPFFLLFFFLTDRNAPIFFNNFNYIVLFEKSAFGNSFGLRKVLELKQSQRRLGIFSSSPSRSPKVFPKVLYNNNSKKNRAFPSVFKKIKNGFFIVFSNFAMPMTEGYFRDTIY